mmetsp:Transcript_4878/g.11325  ORF Transcript_4878/g.11325 Transcript_4878/m.11325 type:complete len:245 (+) Transcript_4878:1266-2000(+)
MSKLLFCCIGRSLLKCHTNSSPNGGATETVVPLMSIVSKEGSRLAAFLRFLRTGRPPPCCVGYSSMASAMSLSPPRTADRPSCRNDRPPRVPSRSVVGRWLFGEGETSEASSADGGCGCGGDGGGCGCETSRAVSVLVSALRDCVDEEKMLARRDGRRERGVGKVGDEEGSASSKTSSPVFHVTDSVLYDPRQPTSLGFTDTIVSLEKPSPCRTRSKCTCCIGWTERDILERACARKCCSCCCT